MNSALRFCVSLAPVAALALGACATTAPPSPLLGKSQQNLQTLRADPEVTRWAPDALADAEKAVKEAQDASSEKSAHLAFMAEKRVEIAKATAIANREEATYKALVSKRDSLGGGNDSITTLSQNVVSTPRREVPIREDEPMPREPEPSSAPSQPTPIQPMPAPEVAASAESNPATSTNTGDALLALRPTDFSRSGSLTRAANNAVRNLLSDLVKQPSRMVVISGGSSAQLASVRKALAGTGVPSWRLQTRQTSAPGVSVDFGGGVSTPTGGR